MASSSFRNQDFTYSMIWWSPQCVSDSFLYYLECLNLQSSTICCYDLFGLQERSKSPVTDPQIVTLIFTGLQLFSGIPIEFHFLQLTESPPYPF
uniref:Uncharacterized protein n=1 Tax=Trichobilharzia regenti TaxID=157069 RepID=A0AA85JFT1_TRIRE|nr:unnamed protein product [Trichobilharzia regenti]